MTVAVSSSGADLQDEPAEGVGVIEVGEVRGSEHVNHGLDGAGLVGVLAAVESGSPPGEAEQRSLPPLLPCHTRRAPASRILDLPIPWRRGRSVEQVRGEAAARTAEKRTRRDSRNRTVAPLPAAPAFA